MGRPPLPVGTYGEVRVYELGPKKFRARTLYRDYDGKVRPMERVGPSKAAATNKLTSAIRDRAKVVANEEVERSTRMGHLVALWLAEVEESDKAYRTKQTYRESWERDLKNAVADLQVFEMTVATVTRILRKINKDVGAGSAKHAKVVLSGALSIAVQHGVLDTNPIREVKLGSGSKRSKKTKDKFTLGEKELLGLRRHLRTSENAERFARQDLLDLVDTLSALGCRIGELLALDWSKFDSQAGKLSINATVIRVKRVGLTVQEYTKSDAGMRTVTLPKWAALLLVRRQQTSDSKWIFPGATGGLRDPDNTRRMLREAVAETQWEGLHPHAFRHLVATRLDEAGLSAREIADYLGHERVSMTQDVYMNRKTDSDSAARALASMAPGGA